MQLPTAVDDEQDSLPLDASFFDADTPVAAESRLPLNTTPLAIATPLNTHAAANSSTPYEALGSSQASSSFATPAPLLKGTPHHAQAQPNFSGDSLTSTVARAHTNLYSSLDQTDDPQHLGKHPLHDTHIHHEIEKCTQAWITESVVPEITQSFFLSEGGTALSDALRSTDQLISQMVPKMDKHSRLTLLLNERALKRVCHITRLLKARRMAKGNIDPTSAVLWQMAAVQHGCEDEAPLDNAEFDQVVALHQQMRLTQTKLPLLASCHDILHFEVVSQNTSRQKLIDAAAAYTGDLAKYGGPVTEGDAVTERVAAIVDSAIGRRGAGGQSQLTAMHAAGGHEAASGNTPWTMWRTPNTHMGTMTAPRTDAASSWSFDAPANEQVVPVGTVLTMAYGVVQDLLHEGHFVAYC